jgi:soluble lytic murein transglycosylase
MRRLGLLLLLVVVLAAGTAAAWTTASHWYRAWMPVALGRIAFPLRHTADVRVAAARNRLDPALVAAVIYAESRFNDRVKSRQGAVGLMQVLPSTAREIARRSGGLTFVTSDLDTPRVNILYGCYYLRYLLDRYGGSLLAALAAYNAGASNVDAWLAGAAGGELTVARIPFVETRAYVSGVLRLRDIYRHVYGAALGG